MHYINHYHSPLGTILLAADDTGLTGLWFEGQKYFAQGLDKETEEKELSVFQATRRWLDVYFSGQAPDFQVPLHFQGTTFQKEVWKILLSIPYGETTTYGAIAKQLAAKRGLPHLSAQAVLVQLAGQDTVLVENYRGILEYSCERLVLQTKTCRLIIEGSGLFISYYTGDEMKITGHIDQIHYC